MPSAAWGPIPIKKSCRLLRKTLHCLVASFLLLGLLLVLRVQILNAGAGIRPQLLVISMDGFRADYLSMFPNQTAFLNSLANSGVFVSSMVAGFPTKTLPNHWTMATGLFQESHGIVDNVMYDPLYKATFVRGSQDERWWNASLPVWVSARLHGLCTAAFCWPGSEVAFGGTRPDYYYDMCSRSDGLEKGVQSALEWITEDGVDLALLFLHEPDAAGHRHGPHSSQAAEAVGQVDAAVASLVQELKRRGFEDRVNILIVSDHGMTALNTDKVINFNHTLDRFVHSVHDAGLLLSLNAKPGKKRQLMEFLRRTVSAKNLPVQVFDKETMPTRFHYSKHRRIPDVLILPNETYHVVPHQLKLNSGIHGFDNLYRDMRVPMIAVGPSFRKGVRIDGFRQVDIYGLICRLLEIQPQPNNGSQRLLPLMLK